MTLNRSRGDARAQSLSLHLFVQVPDIQTGFEFRLDMYKHMGMTLPEKPPKKILFWFRTPPLYRSILNPEPLLALVEQYKWDYT